MELLSPIFDLCSAIYDAVQAVNANEEACRALVDRIRTIESGLVALESEHPERINVLREPLANLVVALSSAQELIDDHVASGKVWLFLRSGAFAERFAEVDSRLSRAQIDLQLGGQVNAALDFKAIMSLARMNQAEIRELLAMQSADIAGMISAQQASLEGAVDRVLEKRLAGVLAALQEQKPEQGPAATVTSPKGTQLKSWQVAWQDIIFERRNGDRVCIGRGAFGAIYAATYWGVPVAVKVFSDNEVLGVLDAFRVEVGALSRLRHPSIIGFVGATMPTLGDPTDVAEFAIVMERGAMSLRRALAISKEAHAAGDSDDSVFPRGVAQKESFILQLAEGLLYLHHSHPPIVHGDVSLSNVVVAADGSCVKLIDFGLATVRATTLATKSRLAFPATTDGISRHHRGFFGFTDMYAAPEVLQHAFSAGREPFQRDPAQDIYALGCAMYELLTGELAWPPVNGVPVNLVEAVANNRSVGEHFRIADTSPLAASIPKYLRDLIVQCTNYSPQRRPTAAMLLAKLVIGSSPESASSTPGGSAIARLRGRPGSRPQSAAPASARGAPPADLQPVPLYAGELPPALTEATTPALDKAQSLLWRERAALLRETSQRFLAVDNVHFTEQQCLAEALARDPVGLGNVDTSLNGDGLMYFTTRYPAATRLSLRSNPNMGERELVHLQRLKRLSFLDLHCNARVTDTSLWCIQLLTSLTHLDIAAAENITDAGLAMLHDMSEMVFLDVSAATRISDRGVFDGLAAMPKLQSLRLHSARGVSDASIAVLTHMQHLKVLDIGGAWLSQGAGNLIAALATAQVSQLSELYIGGPPPVAAHELAMCCAAQLPAIKRLTVGGVDLLPL